MKPLPNRLDPATLIFILIVAVFIALRLWRLTTYGLWFDETFSLHAARLSLPGLLNFTATDIVHPPLFYLLLKGWIQIGGDSVLWLKLFPLLTAVASIIPFVLLCRELRLKSSELNLSLFLFAVNAYLIYYAQELRMYSLLLCLTLFSLALFLRFISRGPLRFSYWLLVVNVLLVYTHYFGWFVVFAELLYVLFWRRHALRHFVVLVLVLGVCYVPWALFVAKVLGERKGLGENLNWLGRPGLAQVIWYYATLNGTFLLRRTTPIGLLLFSSPVIFWLYQRFRERLADALKLKFLLFVSLVPVVSALVASYVLPQSIWGERYLIVASVPYLMLVACAALRVPFRQLKPLLVILIVAWAGLSGYGNLASSKERINWYDLANTMIKSERGKSSVNVYAEAEFVASPVRFSLASLGEQKFTVIAGNDMFGRPVRDVLQAAFADSHFWLAYRPDARQTYKPHEVLRARGCRIENEFEVSARDQKIIYFPVDCP